jgi:hypothetical protein
MSGTGNPNHPPTEVRTAPDDPNAPVAGTRTPRPSVTFVAPVMWVPPAAPDKASTP